MTDFCIFLNSASHQSLLIYIQLTRSLQIKKYFIFSMLLNNLAPIRYFMRDYRRHRPMSIWKSPHYQAIPYYIKPHFIDIHDTYQLRSRQEVLQQLRKKKYQMKFVMDLYTEDDRDRQEKERKARCEFDIKQFEFTDLQLARFKVLMGIRFDQKKNLAKITCNMLPLYQQNLDKLCEMIYEIILQSKRAP